MKIPHSFWLKIVICICIFIAFKALISIVALSSFAVIKIDAEFDHQDTIEVFYASGINDSGFRAGHSKRSDVFAAGIRTINPVWLNSHVARKLRVDTGQMPGTVRLYSLTLVSYYGPDITFNHQQIFDNFTPGGTVDDFTLQQDHVLITTDSEDPFITFNGELVEKNFFLSDVLPLIISALVFIFISYQPIRFFPAFADINTKTSSSGINVGALDGIRGMAALLVLGQHTGVMKGSGIFGVWLFFCLSGFLLATPFIHQPERGLSGVYMSRYIIRRIKRIVPMYYTMITVTILFMGKFDIAIRHYLFLQADGHYWTVAQEMFFYLLLPLVMVVNALLFRNRRLPAIIFLGLTAYLLHRFVTIDIVPLYGNNVTLRPMFGIFLIGVLMAFIYNWSRDTSAALLEDVRFRRSFALAGQLLLLVCLLVSSHLIPGLAHFDAWTRPGWFGLAAGLLILFTLFARNTALDQLMNLLPLRAVGLVGFSFYLVHPMMISCVRGTTSYLADYYPTGMTLFILAGLVSYGVSAFTYSCIERPFIRASAGNTTLDQAEAVSAKP